MIKNIKEGFYLIYRVFFKPITLVEELKSFNRKQRWLLVHKAFLPSIILIIVGTIVGKFIVVTLGIIPFSWINILYSIAGGIAFGITGGIAFGITTSGIAFGTGVGIAGGIAGGIAVGIAGGIEVGIAFGIAFGIAGGIAFGIAFGIAVLIAYLRLILWLIESPILITCYAFSRRKDSYDAIYSLYRKANILWDEIIMIPLPFLSNFLVLLARYDRIRGQEEIIRVATKTKQQGATRLATLQLVAYDISQCKTPEEITQQRERLSWFLSDASPLNPRTKEALRILDDVIRDIGAVTSTPSDYIRQQGFHRVRTRLEDFQTQFVPTGLKGREVLEFNKVAQVWIKIVKQELDRLVEVRVYERIPNPYVAGNPVQPENGVFVGRMEVFRFIEENLTDVSVPSTLVIYGQRRVGKSSILAHLRTRLPANFIPVTIDMHGAASVESTSALLYNIGKEIHKTLESRYGFKLASKSKAEYKDEPFIVFSEFLEGVEKALANRDRKDSFTRLLLCLDEFEEIDVKIKEGIFSSDILKFLRNIMQHHPRILLIFTGCHTIEEMSGDYWSVFFGSTRGIKVSYLDEESARGLIISPIAGFPLKYDQQAVEKIISATRCQPYLLQNTCFNIVLQLNSEQQRYQGTLEDVHKALEKTLFDLDQSFFQGFVWGLAETPLAKVILFLLSKERRNVDELEKGIEISGIKTTRGELLFTLKRLKQRDLIEQLENGVWGFQIELARQWVVKNKSMAEALG